MNKQPKKLSLGRETLRELASCEVAKAEGGATARTFCTCNPTFVTCPNVTSCYCV
jgi:hypothetical protein